MTLNVGIVVTSWLMANMTTQLLMDQQHNNRNATNSNTRPNRRQPPPAQRHEEGGTDLAAKYADINFNPLREALANLDKRVSPSGIGQKPFIDIKTDMVSVEQVNDMAKLVTVVWYIEMAWRDHRLSWNATASNNIKSLYVAPRAIWTPDFRFLEWEMLDRRQPPPDAKRPAFDTDDPPLDDAHNEFVDLMRYANLVVNHEGRVHLSGFIVDEALCSNMNARLYPFDVQTCNFTFKVINARFLPNITVAVNATNTTTTTASPSASTSPSASSSTTRSPPQKQQKPAPAASTVSSDSGWKETRPLEPQSSGDWYDKRVLVRTTGGTRRYILTIERLPIKHIIISIMPPDILTAVAIVGTFYGCQSGERFAFMSMIVTSVLLLLDNVDHEIPIRSSSFPVIAYYYIGLLLVTLLALWLSRISAAIAKNSGSECFSSSLPCCGARDGQNHRRRQGPQQKLLSRESSWHSAASDDELNGGINWPLLAGQFALYDKEAKLRHTSLGDCICVAPRINYLRQMHAAAVAARDRQLESQQQYRRHRFYHYYYYYCCYCIPLAHQRFMFFLICINAFAVVNLWALYEWKLI